MKATVTVYKLMGGMKCPFTASARWEEYCPFPPNDNMWRKMPYNQLAKCAEALALRKAFPAELSALRTDEEMAQAGNEPQVSKASALNTRQPKPEAPIVDAVVVESKPEEPKKNQCKRRAPALRAAVTGK